MILIISNKWDITVDFVVAELRKRGANFLRINTEDLITSEATIGFSDFRILVSKQGRFYDLTQSTKVIWNRRPGKPFDNVKPLDRPSLAVQNFVGDQWFSWLEALQLIPGVTWINHPQSNDAMESKPRQLLMASQIGFLIPDTLISNEPSQIFEFGKKHNGKLIAKALYSPLIEEPDEDFFVFTNVIDINDLKAEEEIRISPSIFQQPLSPKIDYRITVIGDIVYPVRIDRRSEESSFNIDWRTDKTDLDFSACTLPEEIEHMCKRIVKEGGLIFGAIDLVQYKGEFYFLEINPNGEWGWLQQPFGIPIAGTLCDLMMECDKD
jgi:hypothetical protein